MQFKFLIFIFLTNICPSIASAETFGTWFTGKTNNDKFVYAATVNDSGQLLGQYCSPETKNCLWFLGISSACKIGDKYPLLANSDSTAMHLSVLCDEQLEDGMYRYAFGNFNDIDKIIKENPRIGFAIPLQSDNFRIIRFDLSGVNRAIKFMKSGNVKITPKVKDTKDQYL